EVTDRDSENERQRAERRVPTAPSAELSLLERTRGTSSRGQPGRAWCPGRAAEVRQGKAPRRLGIDGHGCSMGRPGDGAQLWDGVERWAIARSRDRAIVPLSRALAGATGSRGDGPPARWYGAVLPG